MVIFNCQEHSDVYIETVCYYRVEEGVNHVFVKFSLLFPLGNLGLLEIRPF